MKRSPFWKRHPANDLVFLIACCGAALLVGLALNALRDPALPLVYQGKSERLEESVRRLASHTPPSRIPVLGDEIDLQTFRRFVEDGKGLVLDARPEMIHCLGHVPGARSLARDDFEKSYARLGKKLSNDKDQPLAVYCSDISCEDSRLVQAALVKLGYTQVAVFAGGWAAWTRARLPEEICP